MDTWLKTPCKSKVSWSRGALPLKKIIVHLLVLESFPFSHVLVFFQVNTFTSVVMLAWEKLTRSIFRQVSECY